MSENSAVEEKVNLSDVVRSYLVKYPDVATGALANLIEQETGHKVTNGLIYVVRSSERRGGQAETMPSPAPQPTRMTHAPTPAAEVEVEVGDVGTTSNYQLVLDWFTKYPTASASQLADRIHEKTGIRLNPTYINLVLKEAGYARDKMRYSPKQDLVREYITNNPGMDCNEMSERIKADTGQMISASYIRMVQNVQSEGAGSTPKPAPRSAPTPPPAPQAKKDRWQPTPPAKKEAAKTFYGQITVQDVQTLRNLLQQHGRQQVLDLLAVFE